MRNLFDYLEAGDTLDQFLIDFPAVDRAKAMPRWRWHEQLWAPMRILLDESLPEDSSVSIEYQQNPRELPMAVVVVVAVTNRLDTVRPLLPELLNRLDLLERRTPVKVGERQSGESV